MQVHVQDVHQLKELDKVANQLPNLTTVSFDINISSADFNKCSSLFESETLTSLDISNFPSPLLSIGVMSLGLKETSALR